MDVDACVMALVDIFEERADEDVAGMLLSFVTIGRVAKRLGAPVDRASLTLALQTLMRAGYFVLHEVQLRTIEDYHAAGLLTTGEATVLRAHQQRSEGLLPESFMPSQVFVLYALRTIDFASGRARIVPFWLTADFARWGARQCAAPLRDELKVLSPKLLAPAPSEFRCAACQATLARGGDVRAARPVDGAVAYAGGGDDAREAVHCAQCSAVVGAVAAEDGGARHAFDAHCLREFRVPLSISVG